MNTIKWLTPLLCVFIDFGTVTNSTPAKLNMDTTSMVMIPAGKFTSGCTGDCQKIYNASQPVKQTFLGEFYMDVHEATVESFKNLYSDGKRYVLMKLRRGLFHNCEKKIDNNFSCNRHTNVANDLTWEDAKVYCESRGKRLPTEMEWEKAARGTDGRPYPWGKEDPDCQHAVLSSCGDVNYARKPCTRPKGNSPYGLCDMIGNVGEWVISARDEGPDDIHIYKGGSFIYPYNPSPWKPYVWKRYRSFPAAEGGIGVRCVWSKTDHNIKLLPTVKERGF